jgi:L-seryl-tRNA(Ser) seleniumtransferase
MNERSQEELFRQIPAVDQLLLNPDVRHWVARTSHTFVVSEIQRLLQEIRVCIRAGTEMPGIGPELENLGTVLMDRLASRLSPALTAVINGTGVILHTNLGRAPLSTSARDSLSALSGQYTNLEFDLASGERSHRDQLLESTLREVLGTEASVIVNNNAAAVFLILNTLAAGREVIVSRGELVEIGGSFRIPDILVRSGAMLREVGTTNKTRISDYRAALGGDTALILRVHPSNYRLLGFTERPPIKDMLSLAREAGVPVVEDLGSGCLVNLAPFGISDEPVVQDSVTAGVDIVCFSGDKLLGGPQAGIIAGKREFLSRIQKNPLMRTFRVEKLIYGALQSTLDSYRAGRPFEEIPVLRMIAMPQTEIRQRARRFQRQLKALVSAEVNVALRDGHSVVGGGSCPGARLPSSLLALETPMHTAQAIATRLRTRTPAIILRIEDDVALLDLRTVLPGQEPALLEGMREAVS